VIQNWDTYGTMAHNYYLYNDPASGRLTWIPWDNNEALSGGGMGRGMSLGSGDSLDHSGVMAAWPLIRYLMDDPVYYAQYVEYVEDTANRIYSPDKMTATYEKAHALIAPYVTSEAAGTVDPLLESVDAFEQSLATLIDHVNQRFTAAQTFVTGIAADS
jgi:spore coat protein CotH